MRKFLTLTAISLISCLPVYAADTDSKAAAEKDSKVKESSQPAQAASEVNSKPTTQTDSKQPVKQIAQPEAKQSAQPIAGENSSVKEDDLLAKGDALADQDKYDAAIAAYKAALKARPNESKIHEKLAAVYLQSNDIRSAVAEDAAAIKLDSKNAAAHQHLGLIAGMTQNFDRAILEEKAAIAIKPDFQEAHAVLGKALASSGHNEEAIATLKQAVALDPTDIDSNLTLAAAYGRESNYQESVKVYKQALALKPDSWLAHMGLGQAYGHLGDDKNQIAELKLAVQYSKDDASVHGHLGSALTKVGDIQGAMQEGAIANQLRFGRYWPSALNKFLLGWACVFLLFGLIFAVTFAGSGFKPQEGEDLIKSFFLVFYKDRPGRFIVTSRRFLFLPEAFSRWFGATRVSIERDLIAKLVMTHTNTGGVISIETADGTSLVFKMSNLIYAPLSKELEKLGYSQNFENQSETLQFNMKRMK